MLLVAVLTALISVNGAVAALRAGGGRDGGAHGALAVAAAAAAGVRRARGLAAGADRHAGERDRLRRRGGARAWGASASSSSRSSASRCVSATIAIVVLLGERLLPERPPALDRARLQRARAHAGRAVRARPRRPDDAADAARRASPRSSIPPRSALVGEPVFPGMVTDSGDLVVLAVQRHGEDLGPARPCSRPATRCCCRARGRRSTASLDDPEVLVVDAPGAGAPAGRAAGRGREAGARGARGDGRRCSRPASCPPAVAGLLAAGALVLLGVLRSSRPTAASRGRPSCWSPG